MGWKDTLDFALSWATARHEESKINVIYEKVKARLPTLAGVCCRCAARACQTYPNLRHQGKRQPASTPIKRKAAMEPVVPPQVTLPKQGNPNPKYTLFCLALF